MFVVILLLEDVEKFPHTYISNVLHTVFHPVCNVQSKAHDTNASCTPFIAPSLSLA